MFRINITTLGKNKDKWVDEAVAHYLKLLKKYADIQIYYLPDVKNSKSLSKAELIDREQVIFEKNLKSDYIIALSDKGRSFNSEKFAEFLSRLERDSRGSADFIIGGVYGLSSQFIDNCQSVLSLSPMTMSHQLVRPVLLEQLYRGFSILAGGSYHK
ncbi:MAG: 23S rRNA (pseudouridine(1915)-N(3))-methyltransferase RlmH [candidate division Zixibacteria bacterium HGW-Zixibacteria-1]|nr:MAG: 23S rRNA (pseudouridine(1915)-N(3))-methyltransferase RlmH [candidate division Zixibacteria bacterium HGW-Zixibacteria-1]